MKHVSIFLYALTLLCAPSTSARIVRDDDDSTTLLASAQKPAKTITKKTSTPSSAVEKTDKPSQKKLKTSKKQETTRNTEESAQSTAQAVSAAPTTPAKETIDDKIKQLEEAAEKERLKLQTQTEQKISILKHQEALKELADQQKAIADELAKLQPAQAATPAEAPKTDASHPDSVPTTWKLTETAKFNRLSTELADTVTAGESDEGEINEFAQIFEDQRTWFDAAMTNTSRIGDEYYTAILERNKRLETLVIAQKKTLPLLMKEINIKKVAKSDYDRAATILLYDLNALLNDPEGWNGVIPTDEKELQTAVKAAIFNAKDPSFSQASPSHKALVAMQKKLSATQKLIEERNKKVLELEITIAANQDKLDRLKINITEVESAKKLTENELKKLQEKSSQDISAMKNDKATIETQLNQAKTDAKEIKAKLESISADATKTSSEKTELQTQSKELSKKIDELNEKKHSVEKSLDEEQHKRRELELQVEQIKFKQEQAEKDSKKLEGENSKLDSIRKELSEQVDSKNKTALEMNLELERLRRELNSKNNAGMSQAAQEIASIKEDFDRQIHELKMVVLKKDNPLSLEAQKEELEFAAHNAEKKVLKKKKALKNRKNIVSAQTKKTDHASNELIKNNKKELDALELKTMADSNKQELNALELKTLEETNKKELDDLESKTNEYLKSHNITA